MLTNDVSPVFNDVFPADPSNKHRNPDSPSGIASATTLIYTDCNVILQTIS